MKMFGSRMILLVLDQIQKAPVYPTGSGESDGSQTVSNLHVNPYIDEKCMLLCENQALRYGTICSTCSNMNYEENILLCQLYTSIEDCNSVFNNEGTRGRSADTQENEMLPTKVQDTNMVKSEF